MKQKIANAWAAVKREAIKVEFWIKNMAMIAVSGGLNAAHEMYMQGISFAATPAHWAILKAKFIEGAVVGTLAYWAKGPFSQKDQ